MFDGIPFGRAGRVMTDGDRKAQAVAQPGLQLLFPDAIGDAVAAASIGQDQ